MDIINVLEMREGETRNIDICMDSSRIITLSFNSKNISLEMPYGNVKVTQGQGSFFASVDRK